MHKMVIIYRLQREAITFEIISISTYTGLYFVIINKETYIIVNLKKTYYCFYKFTELYIS